jgi:hypothetical protein
MPRWKCACDKEKRSFRKPFRACEGKGADVVGCKARQGRKKISHERASFGRTVASHRDIDDDATPMTAQRALQAVPRPRRRE